LTFLFSSLFFLVIYNIERKIRRSNENSATTRSSNCKRVEEEETTKGGIIIPDSAKEKPMEGIVVAVGSGKAGEEGEKRYL